MKLATKVRVAGQGDLIWEVVEKDSPVRPGEWIVRREDGSMLSVTPSNLAEVVTDKNYLEVLDTKSAMEVLDLVTDILRDAKDKGKKVDDGVFEKPWHWPEVWVPALNGTLEEFDSDRY